MSDEEHLPPKHILDALLHVGTIIDNDIKELNNEVILKISETSKEIKKVFTRYFDDNVALRPYYIALKHYIYAALYRFHLKSVIFDRFAYLFF